MLYVKRHLYEFIFTSQIENYICVEHNMNFLLCKTIWHWLSWMLYAVSAVSWCIMRNKISVSVFREYHVHLSNNLCRHLYFISFIWTNYFSSINKNFSHETIFLTFLGIDNLPLVIKDKIWLCVECQIYRNRIFSQFLKWNLGLDEQKPWNSHHPHIPLHTTLKIVLTRTLNLSNIEYSFPLYVWDSMCRDTVTLGWYRYL